MTKTLLSLALLSAFATSALANIAPDAAVDACGTASMLQARRGADDAAGDDRGNHGPGHKAMLAKRGADDAAGDDRGNHGPGHKAMLAKRGADDAAGDDRGNHGPGHKAMLA